MHYFLKSALRDLANHRFLHAVTVITIALSVLIVSAFGLFFVNVNDLMNSWKSGVRIAAYVDKGAPAARLPETREKIEQIDGVSQVVLISRDAALDQLKTWMKRQSAIFDNLKENPLSDLFEIRLNPTTQSWRKVEIIAAQVQAMDIVDTVEYGQQWLGRITAVFSLLNFAGSVMCCVFFMATIFIVANTIRLLFYSRQEEFTIMRLVGATDGFIKAPFYIGGLIQGILGGLLGLLVLYGLYAVVLANMGQSLSSALLQVRFLPVWSWFAILGGSLFSGWLGCYLSLKQFLVD